MSADCPHRRTRKVGRTREGVPVIDADCIECGETATPDLLGRTIDRGHGVATDGGEDELIPSGEEIHANDWECRDCGVWYGADEDANRSDLPDFCPECGDTIGWVNVKTGRKVPDIATDGGRKIPPHEADGEPWDWQVRSLTATNLYDDAMREWGADAQAAKASEECAELAAVLSRDLNGQASLDELLQEIVDVRIMLEQLALTFGLSQDDLEAEVTTRLQHLDGRLDGGDVE